MNFWTGAVGQFAVAMLATVCFGVTFEVPVRHLTASGLTGAVGWLFYIIGVGPLGLSAPTATLLAALPLTPTARLYAVRHRAPITLFLLCGIFPLVPGAGIYYTAYYFLNGAQQLCVSKGVETFKTAVALALGIALVCSIPLPAGLLAPERGAAPPKKDRPWKDRFE